MRISMIIASMFATAAVVAVASPASAQGFRAELHTGWDRVGGGGQSDDGIAYGIGLGYDAAISSKVLLGVEANLEDSSIKECFTTGTGNTATKSCGHLGRDINVNARLGYKVSDRGTLYGLVGYTNTRSSGTTTVGSGSPVKVSANLDGIRVGAGYEHTVADNIFLKGEYRYSNYEGGAHRHQMLAGVGVRF